MHRHDIAFAEFLKVNKMEIPRIGVRDKVFFIILIIETNHKIYYFIESKPIVKTYITFQRECQNLSTHDPVMICIEVEIPETLISAKIPRKLRIK